MKLGTKISLGVIVGGLLGIGLYLYRQSVLLQSICYDFLTITYLGTENGVAKINTALRFTNYADYPITLKRYKIDVLVDNQKVGELDAELHEVIPARGTKDLSFIATAKTDVMLQVGIQTILEQLIDQTQSVLQIKGTAAISTGIVSIKDYPIDYTATTGELLEGLKNEGESCKKIT